MKLLGNVLLALSLAVGTLAAATAYLARPLEALPEGGQAPLTLNADAGLVVLDDVLPLAVAQEHGPLLAAQQALSPLGSYPPLAWTLEAASFDRDPFAYRALTRLTGDELANAKYDAGSGAILLAERYRVPLFRKKDQLSERVIRALDRNFLHGVRAPVVSHVIVQEFSLDRWPGRWVFLAAAVGLLVAAGLLRSASRRGLSAAGVALVNEGPETALRAMRATIENLCRDMPLLAGRPERLLAIVERTGALQKTHMPAFVEARPLLIARQGLGGYAELMDRYAAAERQIYRAWSAAADGVLEEAVHCLTTAAGLLQESQERLGERPL